MKKNHGGAGGKGKWNDLDDGSMDYEADDAVADEPSSWAEVLVSSSLVPTSENQIWDTEVYIEE